jgi:type VI secretion system Hcp family effector
VCAVVVAWAPIAQAATGAYLHLSLGGEQVSLEPTTQSRLGAGIALFSVSVLSTGGPSAHGAIVITKAVDETTPRLLEAWAQDESVDLAEIRLYRPATVDGGESSEHFFTITIRGGSIANVSLSLPYASDPNAPSRSAYETIELVAHTITYAHEPSGSRFETHLGEL